jgi:hypothetical protein
MGVALVVMCMLIVLMALRIPAANTRASGLPTAIPGVSLKSGEFATAIPKSNPSVRGPTSTPAPFATKLPPTPLPPPKGIPHDLKGKDDCLYCHKGKTYFAVPATHARRTNDSCLGCHNFSSSAPRPTPRAMPHSTTNRDACLMCHLRGDNGAKPIPGNHTGFTTDTCTNCHRSK